MLAPRILGLLVLLLAVQSEFFFFLHLFCYHFIDPLNDHFCFEEATDRSVNIRYYYNIKMLNKLFTRNNVIIFVTNETYWSEYKKYRAVTPITSSNFTILHNVSVWTKQKLWNRFLLAIYILDTLSWVMWEIVQFIYTVIHIPNKRYSHIFNNRTMLFCWKYRM